MVVERARGIRTSPIAAAVALQAVPVIIIAAALLIDFATQSSYANTAFFALPFSFGLGYLYLGRKRRFVITFCAMLLLVVGPLVALMVWGTGPGETAAEGLAILLLVLGAIDLAIVTVVNIVLMADVWRLATNAARST